MATPTTTSKFKTSCCEACGQELLSSGNYCFRIIPAKKMPKKSIKLHHNPLLLNDNPKEDSKFQKHLRERSQRKNSVELICGYCKSNTKIRMNKPGYVKPSPTTPGLSSSMPHGTDTDPNSSKKRNKKPKVPKDLYAGLTIPASMLSASAASSSSNCSTPLTSSLLTHTQEPNKSSGNIGKPQKLNPELRKKMAQAEKQTKLKAMDNLKKVLYKSKQMGSSSMNLQNFLGES